MKVDEQTETSKKDTVCSGCNPEIYERLNTLEQFMKQQKFIYLANKVKDISFRIT